MSKYKAGDKVVVEVYDAGNGYTLFDCCTAEPLSNYTEPLQNKVADQRKEINHLLRKIKEKEAAIERLEDELRSRAQKLTWQKGVEAGQNEAWELARKIASTAGGLSSSELIEIFNAFLPRDILSENTYPEAAAKVAQWEKAKEEIKVGDVVRGKSDIPAEFCVTEISSYGRLYGIGRNGETYSGRNPEDWHKTGRHIDIDSFLKQIGEEK